MRSDQFSLLAVLISTSSVSALEPAKLFAIQRGPVVLKPQFQTSIAFTDNVNYREVDKISDFLATISPGLAIQVGAKDANYFDLSYFYDRLQYFDHNEFNANQHRIAAVARFEKSRFTLNGRDDIAFLSSPLGGGFSLAGRMVERTTFSDYYRLSYDFTERTQPYAAITHSATDYEESLPLYDSRSIFGTLGFGYGAFSRTFLFGEVYFGQTTNDENAPGMADYPTATFIGGFVGVRGQFTEKLSGTIKAGYQTREYSGGAGSTSHPVVDASLTHNFSEATVFTVAYSRRQDESVQFVRTGYVSDSFSGAWRQNIGADGRLRSLLHAAFYHYDYETSSAFAQDRADSMVSSGLTITYDIKLWMRVFGGYTFEWFDSTEPFVVDYMVNRVRFGLELGY